MPNSIEYAKLISAIKSGNSHKTKNLLEYPALQEELEHKIYLMRVIDTAFQTQNIDIILNLLKQLYMTKVRGNRKSLSAELIFVAAIKTKNVNVIQQIFTFRMLTNNLCSIQI